MTSLSKKANTIAEAYGLTPDLRPALVMDIKELAREFAERALKEFCNYDDIASGTGVKACNEAIAKALAAAEKEKT